MALLRVGPLPDAALAAAAAFHAEVLPRVEDALAGSNDAVTLVFAPAGYEQRGWRLAAVQGLARDHAPRRVNAIESDDAAAIAAAEAWLATAPGVTGQILPLDGAGAGRMV